MLYLVVFLPLCLAIPPELFQNFYRHNYRISHFIHDGYGNVVPASFPGSPNTIMYSPYQLQPQHNNWPQQKSENIISAADADDFSVYLNEDFVNSYEPAWFLEKIRKAKEQAEKENSERVELASIDQESLINHLNSLRLTSDGDLDELEPSPPAKKQKSPSSSIEKERQMTVDEKFNYIQSRLAAIETRKPSDRYAELMDTTEIVQDSVNGNGPFIAIGDADEEEENLDMESSTPKQRKSPIGRKERRKLELQMKRKKKQAELADAASRRKQLEIEEQERKRIEYLDKLSSLQRTSDDEANTMTDMAFGSEIVEEVEEEGTSADEDVVTVDTPISLAQKSYEEAIKETKFAVRTFEDYAEEIFAIPSYLTYISGSLKPDTFLHIKSLFEQTRRKDPQPMVKTKDYLSMLGFTGTEEVESFNDVMGVYFMALTISEQDLIVADQLNEHFNSFLKSIEKLKIGTEVAKKAEMTGPRSTKSKGKRKATASSTSRKGVKIMIFGDQYLLDSKSVTKLTTLVMKIKPHLELFKHTLLFQYSVVSTFHELAEQYGVTDLFERFPMLRPMEGKMNKTKYIVTKLDAFRKIFETMATNNIVKRTVII